jgi:hypothetical protein
VEKKKGSLRRGVLCLGADEIHLRSRSGSRA